MREGPYGSAWFAHRANDQAADQDRNARATLPGIQPERCSKRSSACRAAHGVIARLVVAEAPIDAMSFAALGRIRTETLYAATASGMRPNTIDALNGLLQKLARRACSRLVIATPADKPKRALCGPPSPSSQPGRACPRRGFSSPTGWTTGTTR